MKADKQSVPRENPPTCTMARRLRDFTRINSPVYTGSRILRISRKSVGNLCCMTAWDISGLWSMSNKWSKIGIGSILGQGTCQDKMRIIFEGRVVLKSMISPCVRRESPTKGSHVPPMVTMIGIPTPELRV